MVEPEWVIFDVGAVLLDWPKSLRKLAGQIGVDEAGLYAELRQVAQQMSSGAISTTTGWSKILEALQSDFPPEQVPAAWCDASNWNSDTLLLLEQASRQYKTALFTNSWLHLKERIAKGEAPDSLKNVREIFDSQEMRLLKPADESYALVEQSLGVKAPQALLLIDDDIRNIKTASDRYWQTYHYHMGKNGGMESNQFIRNLLHIV